MRGSLCTAISTSLALTGPSPTRRVLRWPTWRRCARLRAKQSGRWSRTASRKSRTGGGGRSKREMPRDPSCLHSALIPCSRRRPTEPSPKPSMRVPRRTEPTLTTRRLDRTGMWPVGQQTAPETRKPLPRELGEGLGTSGVHLKAEAETRPDQTGTTGLRARYSLSCASAASPQAECRPSSAHADIGPLGIAPRIHDLLLAQAGIATIAIIGSSSGSAERGGPEDAQANCRAHAGAVVATPIAVVAARIGIDRAAHHATPHAEAAALGISLFGHEGGQHQGRGGKKQCSFHSRSPLSPPPRLSFVGLTETIGQGPRASYLATPAIRHQG